MCEPAALAQVYEEAAARLGLPSEIAADVDHDVTVVFNGLRYVMVNHAPDDAGFLSVMLSFRNDSPADARQSVAASLNGQLKGMKVLVTDGGFMLVAESLTTCGDLLPPVTTVAMTLARMVRSLYGGAARVHTELELVGIASASA